MNHSHKQGYRGYIGARMEMGRSVPQHIQQLVIRDYCAKRHMAFLLSATEYCMPDCTQILDAVLADLHALDGIVMYSLFLMPRRKEKRVTMYQALFSHGAELHCAAEGHVIRSWEDAARIEDIWLTRDVITAQDSQLLAQLKQYA